MVRLSPVQDSDYNQVTIEAIWEEVPGVKTLILRPQTPVRYQAGQFLTFVFEDIHGEQRRSYSFSSSDELREPMAITLKRVVNGKYSRPLIDYARPGDVLSVAGTAGQFTLPENIEQYSEFFFFAAGIGITPVYSLIKTLLYGHPDKEVILVYSNTSSETTVFHNELMQLQGQFPGRFRVELLLSSSRDLTRARLSKWLLPALLKTHSGPNKAEHIFYTCGPFAYMRMVILSLEEAGYSQEQIKKENFDTYRPAPRLVPPDTKPHKVSIRTRKATASLALSYPATILQAAKSAGIDIPYSCETGRCGSCLMQCTGGEIWMSYNEVLTEKEIAEGKILACVGHPIHGDASVELL